MEYRRKRESCIVLEAVETVLEIQETLQPRGIMILDACFGLDRDWRRAVLSELAERQLRCGFWIQTRIDLIDEEDLALLAKLNVKIDLGVDSFSRTMLEIMRKTADADAYLEKFLDLSRNCSRWGIEHDAYLIFNHPGESEETIEEHETFLRRQVFPELRGGMLWLRSGAFSRAVSYSTISMRSGRGTDHPLRVRPGGWRKRDQLTLSRSVIPSRDEGGTPFCVEPKRIGNLIGDFSRFSRRLRQGLSS
jgi:Radical SAM superfamily